MSGFKSLETVNLTSKTKKVAEGRKCTKTRNWKRYWIKIRAKRKKNLHVQKQGNWVPYELTPRNVERKFSTCEMLLARHKRKGFLHRIFTGDEKWIHYDEPKRKKSWGPPGHASTSTAKSNFHGKKKLLSCIWLDQFGVVYYELLEFERNNYWGCLPNTIDELFLKHSRKSAPTTTPDTTKTKL